MDISTISSITIFLSQPCLKNHQNGCLSFLMVVYLGGHFERRELPLNPQPQTLPEGELLPRALFVMCCSAHLRDVSLRV